jgi:hypothetical protein
MAAARANNELKALQERVAELERQLLALKAQLSTGRPSGPHWPNVPMTDEEAEAFHRSSQRVHKIIQRFRETDRRKAAAEYDRLHGKTHAPSPKRKVAKAAARSRKAG